MTETTVSAKLPHLDVEMTREEPGPGKPEVITMRLTATPSMEAFGEHLSKGLPFFGPAAALSMMQPFMTPMANPMLAPMQAWTKMVQDAWAPFLPAPDRSSDKIEGPDA
ncbi:MAG: hypothetical protein AAF409_09295 [Pseudomonadota bacterium]